MAGNSNAQSCVVIFQEKCSDSNESVQIERNISNFDEIKVVRRKDEGEKSIFDRPGIKVNIADSEMDICGSNSKIVRNFEKDREITIANEDSGVDSENFGVKCSKLKRRKKDRFSEKSDFSRKKSEFSENTGSSFSKSDKDLEALKEAYEILRESPKKSKKRSRKLSENSKSKNSTENSTSSSPNSRKRRKKSFSEKSEKSEFSENSPEIDEIYSNYLENVFPYYENSELPARSSKKKSPNFYRYRYTCRYAGYNRSIKRNLRDTYKKNKSYLEYLRTNIAITAINAIKEISTKI